MISAKIRQRRKMRPAVIFLMIVGIVVSFVIVSCVLAPSDKGECNSGLHAADGECCSYVCTDRACPDGYKEGTCNCECDEGTGQDDGTGPSDDARDSDEDYTQLGDSVDDVFGGAEDTTIVPPGIPV